MTEVEEVILQPWCGRNPLEEKVSSPHNKDLPSGKRTSRNNVWYCVPTKRRESNQQNHHNGNDDDDYCIHDFVVDDDENMNKCMISTSEGGVRRMRLRFPITPSSLARLKKYHNKKMNSFGNTNSPLNNDDLTYTGLDDSSTDDGTDGGVPLISITLREPLYCDKENSLQYSQDSRSDKDPISVDISSDRSSNGGSSYASSLTSASKTQEVTITANSTLTTDHYGKGDEDVTQFAFPPTLSIESIQRCGYEDNQIEETDIVEYIQHLRNGNNKNHDCEEGSCSSVDATYSPMFFQKNNGGDDDYDDDDSCGTARDDLDVPALVAFAKALGIGNNKTPVDVLVKRLSLQFLPTSTSNCDDSVSTQRTVQLAASSSLEEVLSKATSTENYCTEKNDDIETYEDIDTLLHYAHTVGKNVDSNNLSDLRISIPNLIIASSESTSDDYHSAQKSDDWTKDLYDKGQKPNLQSKQMENEQNSCDKVKTNKTVKDKSTMSIESRPETSSSLKTHLTVSTNDIDLCIDRTEEGELMVPTPIVNNSAKIKEEKSYFFSNSDLRTNQDNFKKCIERNFINPSIENVGGVIRLSPTRSPGAIEDGRPPRGKSACNRAMKSQQQEGDDKDIVENVSMKNSIEHNAGTLLMPDEEEI